jgi:phosphoglycolate phosphatase
MGAGPVSGPHAGVLIFAAPMTGLRPQTLPMTGIDTVLFDLDGTLIDSSGAIRASLTHALERLGAGWPDGMAVESVIGMPLLDILRERFDITGEEAERGIRFYREHYNHHAREASRVYDHVETLLEHLSAAGLGLFVATVKPTAIAEQVLEEMRLSRWFSGVAGSSMDHARREKSAIIGHALEAFGLRSERSVMVGDRRQDIDGARRNGLRSVGVTYGFGSREELLSAGPDLIVDCSSEIAAYLLPPGVPTT